MRASVRACVCVCALTTADSTASYWVQEVAAWQVKVYEANSRASGAETSLADAQTRKQDLRDHLSQKQAIEAGLLGDIHDLASQLAAAQAKEQDLAEKLACKHANQQKLQAQVCSLASQLNAALASSRQVGVCCTTLHVAFCSCRCHYQPAHTSQLSLCMLLSNIVHGM